MDAPYFYLSMNICLVNFVPRVLSYPFYGGREREGGRGRERGGGEEREREGERERERERPREITKDDMERGAIKSEVCRYLTYPDTKTTCLKKYLWFVSQ